MKRAFRQSAHQRLFVAAATAVLTVSAALPAPAQMGGAMKNRIVDDVANELVNTIQSDNCAQFEAMLKSKKGGSGGNKAGGMMKKDPQARARFVDKVAGPLVNKMIDCNLLPGR